MNNEKKKYLDSLKKELKNLNDMEILREQQWENLKNENLFQIKHKTILVTMPQQSPMKVLSRYSDGILPSLLPSFNINIEKKATKEELIRNINIIELSEELENNLPKKAVIEKSRTKI